ncbi:MAG: metallophosphoesterase [Chloroflexi bacterium]|nr:metallophosphoesterase [Chloroflexota bacterium]MCI0578427.1 metallophosphoesterase [Chloroflexota bacterium]MCI0644927.1 metallophosphoesterase [Chloroflexota bacterium]MCI0731950.1 metallophosphoesterase [Chloroflexota bacterium]
MSIVEDVLLNSLLYKAMVLFHKPAGWPVALVAGGALALAAGAALAWRLTLGETVLAATAGLVLLFFALADGWLLRALPRWRVSFGPWKAQLFVLLVARMMAAVGLALPARAVGAEWGLAVLVLTQTLGSAALAWGTLVEPFRLRLTHLAVESTYLPAGAPPIRLLHISDLHVERLTRREEKLLKLVEEAAADLIVITGDYLNLSYVQDPVAQAEARRLLAQLSAPHGVYAILGSPPVDAREVAPSLFAGLPIQLLVDEWAVVELGDGRRLILLGLDCSHRIPVDARRLERLVAVSPNSAPRVLLYHAPDLMPQAAGHGIDLYLCGHTHGGQVRLPWFGALLTSSQFGKRYEMGLYREGQTHLYVSRGVGLEGLSAPRVRFLAPPEITLVTIGGE